MRRFNGSLERRGKDVPVYRDTDSKEDAFGQTKDTWKKVDTVLTVRSYPNRNTTDDQRSGPLTRDRPVFFFKTDAAPKSGDRIQYNGVWYELESPTNFESHVVMMANAQSGFSP